MVGMCIYAAWTLCYMEDSIEEIKNDSGKMGWKMRLILIKVFVPMLRKFKSN